MTNLIIGWRGAGNPPSPWARWTDGDGRYLRFTATVGDAKAKAGSATHTHTVINLSVANPGEVAGANPLGSQALEKNHTNHGVGSSSISSANNDPEYYSFALIYMDLATWEASERRFPQDALVFSQGALSWSEVSRDTSADGKLIMLSSTPGQVGGTATRSHNATVTLGSGGGSASIYVVTLNAGNYEIAANHTHGVSGTITSSALTTKPARITTRIYAANVLTTKALAGVVCMVDDTPSANWTIVNWTGKFLESANTDATSTGSSTQTHTGLSGTSGIPSNSGSQVYSYQAYSEDSAVLRTHTHTFTFDLGSANIEPLYYNLVPVSLNSTLVHNTAPNTPNTPTGNTTGIIGQSLSYQFYDTDPEGDNIHYYIDWGDGNVSDIGPYASGATGTVNHSFMAAGTYLVKVKAYDTSNVYSGWSSTLSVLIIDIASRAQLIGIGF